MIYGRHWLPPILRLALRSLIQLFPFIIALIVADWSNFGQFLSTQFAKSEHQAVANYYRLLCLKFAFGYACEHNSRGHNKTSTDKLSIIASSKFDSQAEKKQKLEGGRLQKVFTRIQWISISMDNPKGMFLLLDKSQFCSVFLHAATLHEGSIAEAQKSSNVNSTSRVPASNTRKGAYAPRRYNQGKFQK